MDDHKETFFKRYALPAIFLICLPIIGFLAVLAVIAPFLIVKSREADKEFSQRIPSSDTDRIVGIAEAELFQSWDFRNHTKKPTPYNCSVSDNQKWKKLRRGFQFDHIVVCKIPINCSDGYRYNKIDVYYIEGTRHQGDWGHISEYEEADGANVDRSKMKHCP